MVLKFLRGGHALSIVSPPVVRMVLPAAWALDELVLGSWGVYMVHGYFAVEGDGVAGGSGHNAGRFFIPRGHI